MQCSAQVAGPTIANQSGVMETRREKPNHMKLDLSFKFDISKGIIMQTYDEDVHLENALGGVDNNLVQFLPV